MKKQKKQLIALCILLLICIVAWVGLTKWNKSQEQKKTGRGRSIQSYGDRHRNRRCKSIFLSV